MAVFKFSCNYSVVLELSWKGVKCVAGHCVDVLVYENKCVRHVSARRGVSLSSQILARTNLKMNPNLQNVAEFFGVDGCLGVSWRRAEAAGCRNLTKA